MTSSINIDSCNVCVCGIVVECFSFVYIPVAVMGRDEGGCGHMTSLVICWCDDGGWDVLVTSQPRFLGCTDGG